MVSDLDISFGVYNDGTADYEYGFIGSGEYLEPGGDLHCKACHLYFGPGEDPPAIGRHTRYYREWIDVGGPEPRVSPETQVSGKSGRRIEERE